MASSSLSSSSLKLNHLRTLCCHLKQNRCYSKLNHASTSSELDKASDDVPTSGICRPLSEILKELNKKVPDSLVKTRIERDGFPIRYIPWHVVNRVLNLHAPERYEMEWSGYSIVWLDHLKLDGAVRNIVWSGEVRNITYSADAKSVSVVYRVTLYGTDAEIFRESTGTASIDDTSYGDPVQKAEAMAFRRACARFGLGLHLYHEESS